MAADRSAIRLSPMEVPKASDVLANELRERILSGDYPEGTPLPPERELVVQTRMSRTTVREALRVLEVQGLIRIKLKYSNTGTKVIHVIDRESKPGCRVTLPSKSKTRIRPDNIFYSASLRARFSASSKSSRAISISFSVM